MGEITVLSVGLCDDEELVLDALERIIRECCRKKMISVMLYRFLSGEKLMEKLPELGTVFSVFH